MRRAARSFARGCVRRAAPAQAFHCIKALRAAAPGFKEPERWLGGAFLFDLYLAVCVTHKYLQVFAKARHVPSVIATS